MSDGEIVHLDSYQALETLMERDYKTDKFIFAMFLDDSHMSTYISENLNDMELCYLIKILEETRMGLA